MPVHLTNRQRRFPVDQARLSRLAEACLAELGIGDAELSVLLVNDRAMRTMNRQFRHIDQTTDVLSFPLHDGDPASLEGRMTTTAGEPQPLLGDVVISVERAYLQAAQFEVTPDEELALLLVHGVLHLSGHDHEQGPDEAVRMRTAEQNMLTVLGLSRPGLIRRAEEEM
ncbi:MAG: rRNA maturation RNase YbeY [Leptospirillia bacterium]